MRNKVGADPILSIYWFVIIIVIGVGLVGMVYIFYSAPYDIRSVEAEILSNKLADCIARNGKIDYSFISDKNTNVFEKCSLNFNIEKEFQSKEEQYFFKIEILELNSNPYSKIVMSGGNINWEGDCFIVDKQGEPYKNLVQCSEKRVYAVNDSSNQFLIRVLSGVGKNEKNIKQ